MQHDNNPKGAEGAKKRPLELVPPELMRAAAGSFALGAKKYGPFNWRVMPVSAATYYAAAERHMLAFWDGEKFDPETGECHLHSAIACLGIIVDARKHGTLIDDRSTDLYKRFLEKKQEIKIT